MMLNSADDPPSLPAQAESADTAATGAHRAGTTHERGAMKSV
jgi:hypothetical protein